MHLQTFAELYDVHVCILLVKSLLPVYCPVRVIWCSWCRYCQSPEPCHFSPCEPSDLLQRLVCVSLSVSDFMRLHVKWSRSSGEWVQTAARTLSFLLYFTPSLSLSVSLATCDVVVDRKLLCTRLEVTWFLETLHEVSYTQHR